MRLRVTFQGDVGGAHLRDMPLTRSGFATTSSTQQLSSSLLTHIRAACNGPTTYRCHCCGPTSAVRAGRATE